MFIECVRINDVGRVVNEEVRNEKFRFRARVREKVSNEVNRKVLEWAGYVDNVSEKYITKKSVQFGWSEELDKMV